MDNEFLSKLNKFLDKEIENNEEYSNSVVVMAVEIDKSGRPVGTISKVLAPPFTVLGLIDYMSENLNKLRDNVYEKLQEDQMTMGDDVEGSFKELLSNYPPELRSVVEKYDDQLREAIMNGDIEALQELKRIILDELNNLNGDSGDDDDDFDMKDFTGGSI